MNRIADAVSLARVAYGLIIAMPPASSTPPPNGYDYSQPSQPAPVQPAQAPQPYDFIVNPGEVTKKSIIPGGSSKIVKVLIVLAGILVLFIVFSLVKGLLSGQSNIPSLITVTQDQQTILLLTKDSGTRPKLSVTNSNVAINTQLSVSSSQSELIAYIAKNGKKLSSKDLGLGIDAQTNAALNAATTDTGYNETFKQSLKEKINKYMIDLKQAYAKTSGKKGRALLQNDFKQAELLLIQLNS